MGKRILHKLSAIEVSNFTKRGYYSDGGGLYFRVSEYETRLWAFRFTRVGKAREMGFGAYPDVSLKEARGKAEEARKLLRDDIDPIDHRQAARSAMRAAREASRTFEQCAAA